MIIICCVLVFCSYVSMTVSLFICIFFFFFKQKTAYEMRISDWSSDVCSSDLPIPAAGSTQTTRRHELREDRLSDRSYRPNFASAARRPSSCRRLSLCPLDRSMSRRRAADDNGLPGNLQGLKTIAGPARHMLGALRFPQVCTSFKITETRKHKNR